jgi:hypothetical protein
MTWLIALFVLIAVIAAVIVMQPKNAKDVTDMVWILVMALALLTAFVLFAAQ